MKLLLILSLMLASFVQAKVTKGDTLSISIRGVPPEEQNQINNNYPVSSEGKIHLPYLDSPISASGLSTTSLARRVEAAYRKAQIYTTPNISIQSMREQKVEVDATEKAVMKFLTVSGQVSRPGPQGFRPGLRLIDVVSAAGPTTFAAQNRVELLRNGKIYKYDMKIPAHMVEKVYPKDQITLKEKNWRGQ